MVKHTQKICQQIAMFDHFVGLPFKELMRKSVKIRGTWVREGLWDFILQKMAIQKLHSNVKGTLQYSLFIMDQHF